MMPADNGGGDERHGGKGESVAAYLAAAIRTGRLAPGQRLVEADLTREIGVGRGLLREAFRRLAAEGLIELVPNRGALVRRLSLPEALELFEIRTELEAFAARRAAARIADPCVRAAFEAAIAPIWDEAPREASADYIAENQRFHTAILEAAGNGQLVAVSARLQLPLILSQIRFALTSAVLATSLTEHRGIAAAILAGDADAAADATRLHLERAAAFVRAMPADAFRAEPRAFSAKVDTTFAVRKRDQTTT